MANVYAFISDGMEEVECLAVCDVLIRAGVETKLVSIMDRRQITGSHGFKIEADLLFEELTAQNTESGIKAPSSSDLLFLPGGMPGTTNLMSHKGLTKLLVSHAAAGGRVAAICAAPSVLGSLGLLEGHKATCFPGWEEKLKGADVTGEGVVTDRLVTTGRGMGCSIDMGLELVRILKDEKMARELKANIQYDR